MHDFYFFLVSHQIGQYCIFQTESYLKCIVAFWNLQVTRF